jgi:hypothetical protein
MKERIVSIGILVFALVYLAGSISLKVGTLAQPGAGQFPAAIAFCLLVAAAYNTWRAFRLRETGEEGRSWTQLAPIGIAVVLVVYPLLLKTLSFLLSTFLVLFLMFKLLRFKTTLISFLTALFATVLSFVVFAGLLGVVVPGGIVEQFILTFMEKG